MGDLIKFPEERIARPENVFKKKRKVFKGEANNIKLLHVSSTMEAIIPIVFKYLVSAGFDLSQGGLKEGAFVAETIRSALLRHHNISHPFQKLADSVFEEVGEDTLKIVTKLNVDLEENVNTEKG